ncbi:DUF2634 domain-containing protein [Wukongibacter sp. M2B1]|uniref:DUF2634 domain-containing protein n=1 Tax=Wukongibacter sp. M2B1 TaxID=3088895 RepID=UPI003D799C30
MFPSLDLNAVSDAITTEYNNAKLGRVFLFDFNTGKYLLKDGKMVEATYGEGIKQWVIMLIATEFGKYNVYKDTEFGLRLRQLIGKKNIPIGIINSEVKRQIEEKIVLHPQITGIQNFTAIRGNNELKISFEVLTQKEINVEVERVVSIVV